MDIVYTVDELEEFKRLYVAIGSYDPSKRISAMADMDMFEAKHGRDKCQSMMDRLMYGQRTEEGYLDWGE